jgi:predicted RNA binding protein YcfA (HicA-like mRNA interferase family)
MNVTGKHLERVARKLGYRVKPGRKHFVVYTEKRLITTLPRGRIKPGTLAGILKQLGISKRQLEKML